MVLATTAHPRLRGFCSSGSVRVCTLLATWATLSVFGTGAALAQPASVPNDAPSADGAAGAPEDGSRSGPANPDAGAGPNDGDGRDDDGNDGATIAPVAADGPLPPWHLGVAQADKLRAQALFEEGNGLYDNILLVEAADRYRRALTYWDHPAIQLNLAKTLLLLQRQVEVYETLRRATRYGPGSHDSPAAYQWAEDTLERLESQLVVLDIRCSQPGVEISLDGKSLFSSPGVTERHLLPGQHTLVAKKPGHLTESETLILEPGTRKTVLFSLLPIAHTAIERRRWAPWKPWVVVGSAAALTALGGVLRWRAGRNFEAFDRGFTDQCGGGCEDGDIAADVVALRTRARWQNGFGIGALGIGGASLVAGAALVLLNQPRTVRVSAESGIHIAIAPSVGSGSGGITARAWWRF